MKVEFLNLRAQYDEIRDEIDSVVGKVIRSGKFILGENVSKLEKEIADYCGLKHAVGVASGTDALFLSLLASGIGAGDSVITTPFTFVATAEAILRVGAKVILCDITPETFNIDVGKLEKKIAADTIGILPVHLYGQSADMEPLMEVAREYNLTVIEDVAQAFGGECKGKKLGSFGKAGCFSFFPTKALGAYGDAGMVVTDDGEFAEKVKILRAHGCRQKYNCTINGYNSRLDEIQAAILRVKLKSIDTWISLRREKANVYNRLLRDAGIGTPSEREYAKHAFNYYTIRCPERDGLMNYLNARGIQTAIYYPIPLHLQDAFRCLNCSEGDLPVAEKAAKEVLSLPMFPELTENQQKYVADAITSFNQGK